MRPGEDREWRLLFMGEILQKTLLRKKKTIKFMKTFYIFKKKDGQLDIMEESPGRDIPYIKNTFGVTGQVMMMQAPDSETLEGMQKRVEAMGLDKKLT